MISLFYQVEISKKIIFKGLTQCLKTFNVDHLKMLDLTNPIHMFLYA